MVGASEREIKKHFPNLYKEIISAADSSVNDKGASSSRSEKVSDNEGPGSPRLRLERGRGYDPSVLDFIQRCRTDEEALEIISYLEGRGEISRPYANSLRRRISERGVRDFGPQRKAGHYFKTFRE